MECGQTESLRNWKIGIWCQREFIANDYQYNRFPLIINDVPTPPHVIINNPGCQKLFIFRGEYLLKGFGRAAFKFLLKSIKIELKSR